MENGKLKMKNTKRYAQRLSKVSEWLLKTKEKDFSVPLCLCARNGFIGSAQWCPNCPKWGWTIENGKLKVENGKHKTLCSITL